MSHHLVSSLTTDFPITLLFIFLFLFCLPTCIAYRIGHWVCPKTQQPKLEFDYPEFSNHQEITTVHPSLPNTRQYYISQSFVFAR